MSNLSVVPGVLEVNISWSPPSERNGVIVVYEVGFAITGTTPLNYSNTSDTQYTLSDLSPITSFSIVVRAYTMVGPGNTSAAITVTTDVRKCNTEWEIYVDWG